MTMLQQKLYFSFIVPRVYLVVDPENIYKDGVGLGYLRARIRKARFELECA